MSDKTTKSIICDNCEEELIVDSPYPAKYVLQLESINTGINTGNIEYAIAMEPLIKQALHFCDFKCLMAWVAELQQRRVNR